MKKIILSIAILICFFIAPEIQAQGIGVGIKAGANFSNQSITDISTESKTGFHGGAYVVLAFSEKWAIQPEFLFSSQGSEIPDFDEVMQLDYFSIPVLLRWKPNNFLSFHAGSQFSSLLSAVDKSGDSIKDDIKNSDFGLAVGATVHLPLGFNGGVRYVWGFTNVSDLQDDTEVKNSVVQVYVGWTIFGAK
ncbi:MAG: PorT family protein [Cyclobacteriaceae bacterium]|nr:PorT family protein [Cyclobacteriaceae bacterium]